MLYLAVKYKLTLGEAEGDWYSTVKIDTDNFKIKVVEELPKKEARAFIKEHNLVPNLKSDEFGTIYDTEDYSFFHYIQDLKDSEKSSVKYNFYKKIKTQLNF